MTVLRPRINSVVIIITLGLGLAATAVVSALIGAILFPTLPYEKPERLVVYWSSPRPGAEQPSDYLSAGRARAWLGAPPHSVERLGAAGATSAILGTDQGAQRINATLVNGSFFSVLRASPFRGRPLLPGDSAANEPVAVLSDRAWRRYFRSSSSIIGQSALLDSVSYTIVGVAPAAMDFPHTTDVWVLQAHSAHLQSPVPWLLIGRLRAGVDLPSARAESTRRALLEHQQDSISHGGEGVAAAAIAGSASQRQLGLLPLAAASLSALYLIAALNVAILALLRARARAHDLAVRMALGSGTWRALQPLLVELSGQFLLGGVLAVAGALATLRYLRVSGGFDLAPLTNRAEGIVVFTILLLAAVTLLLTLPLVARRARAANLFGVLRRLAQAATQDRDSLRLRRLLVGGQIAIAIMLASVALLVARSLVYYRGLEVGYDAQRVVVARPDYGRNFSHQRQVDIAQRASAKLHGASGIHQMSYWRRIGLPWPLQPLDRVFALEGRPLPRRPLYMHYEVGPAFLETLGASIVQGRGFDERDRSSSLPVAIVNRTAAQHWWPGEAALGKRVSLNPSDPAAWLTIIGVVDINAIDPWFDRTRLATGRERPQLFRLVAQSNPALARGWNWSSGCFSCPSVTIAARTAGTAERTARYLQATLRELDPNLPVARPVTMFEEQTTDYTGAQLIASTRLLGGFAVFAAFLALLGVYAVIADGLAARRREIAIRVALGATAGRVLRLVFTENTRLASLAVSVGAILYLILERSAGGLLFGGDHRPLLLHQAPRNASVVLPLIVCAILVIALAVTLGARAALRCNIRDGLRAD